MAADGRRAGSRSRTTRPPPRRRRGPPRWLRLVRTFVLLSVVGFVVVRLSGLGDDDLPAGVAGLPARIVRRAPDVKRTVDVHAGYGTWVDVFDYTPSASGEAKVTAADVEDMARLGVRTLYLQASRYDETPAQGAARRDAVAQILVRAHLAGMRVVGWYVPHFGDLDRDLGNLVAVSELEVLGHRFDGVAVDIEWTGDVPDHAERSDRLVALSSRLRDATGDDTLGAIVLPPVQLEVVNQRKWPGFPWRDLADLYDVWLPMGYWTERRVDSGYNDGWTYTAENLKRLRRNLRDPEAVVHPIGGIGDHLTPAHAEGFLEALRHHDAVGGSIYDWATLDPLLGRHLAARLNQP